MVAMMDRAFPAFQMKPEAIPGSAAEVVRSDQGWPLTYIMRAVTTGEEIITPAASDGRSRCVASFQV